jgi:hypothetical protein
LMETIKLFAKSYIDNYEIRLSLEHFCIYPMPI